MKKVICGIMLCLIVFLIIFGITYGAFTLYYLDPNMANWSEQARGTTAILGIAFGAISGLVVGVGYTVNT